MALPEDVTTATLTFGPYGDAEGLAALVASGGKLFPVDPLTDKPINVTHVASGMVIVPTPVAVTIGSDGTGSVGPLPHTDNPGLSPVGFAYRVEWNIASKRPSPGNKTFAVPTAAGVTVDFDLLDVAEAVPGVLVPVTYGRSAYDLAVIEGFVGTEAAWLASLIGPPGLADDNTVSALFADLDSDTVANARTTLGVIAVGTLDNPVTDPMTVRPDAPVVHWVAANGVTPLTADAADIIINLPSARTVASLGAIEPWPGYHRGYGGDVYRDGALSGPQLLRTQGITYGVPDSGDFQFGADGSILAMHDETLDRTTNATGNVSARTLAEWQSGTILIENYPSGTVSTERPPTFEENLAWCRRRGEVFLPECKDNNPALAAAMVAQIIAAGYEASTIFGSFYAANLAVADAAGIPTVLFQSNGRFQAPATVGTSVNGGPPTIVAFDASPTAAAGNLNDTWLAGICALDTKVMAFSFGASSGLGARRTTLAAVQARVVTAGGTLAAYSCDDPYTDIHTPYMNADPFDRDIDVHGFPHGLLRSSTSASAITVAGGWLSFTAPTQVGGCLQGWGSSHDKALTSVEFDVRIDAMDSNTARWVGGRFLCVDDQAAQEWAGGTNLGGQSYNVCLRLNGGMFIARKDTATTGAVVFELATGDVNSPPLTLGQIVRLRFETFGDGRLRLTRLDTGRFIEGVDTAYRGGYFHFLKNGLTGLRCSFGNVAITRAA